MVKAGEEAGDKKKTKGSQYRKCFVLGVVEISVCDSSVVSVLLVF